jgi:hypothetical protein
MEIVAFSCKIFILGASYMLAQGEMAWKAIVSGVV